MCEKGSAIKKKDANFWTDSIKLSSKFMLSMEGIKSIKKVYHLEKTINK